MVELSHLATAIFMEIIALCSPVSWTGPETGGCCPLLPWCWFPAHSLFGMVLPVEHVDVLLEMLLDHPGSLVRHGLEVYRSFSKGLSQCLKFLKIYMVCSRMFVLGELVLGYRKMFSMPSSRFSQGGILTWQGRKI